MRLEKYLVIIIITIVFLYLLCEDRETKGYNDCVNNHSNEVIKVKNDTIKIKDRQAKIIADNVTNNAYRVEWLRWVGEK